MKTSKKDKQKRLDFEHKAWEYNRKIKKIQQMQNLAHRLSIEVSEEWNASCEEENNELHLGRPPWVKVDPIGDEPSSAQKLYDKLWPYAFLLLFIVVVLLIMIGLVTVVRFFL